MEKLARRKNYQTYTLTNPLGTNTTNSRQSEIISELSGATDIIVVVKTSADGTAYLSHFVDGGEATYGDYVSVEPPNDAYGFTYDIQWIPATNEINIRYNKKGSSVSSTGYPKIYAVMYK